MRVLPLLNLDGAMHVLIIEDEPLIAMSIEDALRECGCESFQFATNFQQAIEAASARCPELITADVKLAPGSGIDAVEAICGDRYIPVIFITSTGDEVEARRPGSIILAKPFDLGRIKQAVELALAFGRRRSAVSGLTTLTAREDGRPGPSNWRKR